MERRLEPELMDEDIQARAYAAADFEEPHHRFMELFRETFDLEELHGCALDLGCGPGDITFRFARAFPGCTVHGVDGADAMLHYGRRVLSEDEDLGRRGRLLQGKLPHASLPLERYAVIVSNSLLHHLPDPQVLWSSVRRYADQETAIFIMDLVRPASPEAALALVDAYAADEPEILRRDFHNSLLAAFEPDEVKEQLRRAGMSELDVAVVSDRHLTVSGRLNPAVA